MLHPHTGSVLHAEKRFVAASGWPTTLRIALQPQTRWRWRQLAKLERLQIQNAGKVIAISDLVRRQINERHGDPGDRLVMVRNGIDLNRFGRADQQAVEYWRSRLAPNGELLVVCAGHNHLLKGFDSAVKTVHRLIEQGAKVQLAIAGGRATAT